MVANQLSPGSGARWLSEIETNGASCVSLNFAGFSLKRPRKCLLSSFIGEPSVRGRIDKGAKS